MYPCPKCLWEWLPQWNVLGVGWSRVLGTAFLFQAPTEKLMMLTIFYHSSIIPLFLWSTLADHRWVRMRHPDILLLIFSRIVSRKSDSWFSEMKKKCNKCYLTNLLYVIFYTVAFITINLTNNMHANYSFKKNTCF